MLSLQQDFVHFVTGLYFWSNYIESYHDYCKKFKSAAFQSFYLYNHSYIFIKAYGCQRSKRFPHERVSIPRRAIRVEKTGKVTSL